MQLQYIVVSCWREGPAQYELVQVCASLRDAQAAAATFTLSRDDKDASAWVTEASDGGAHNVSKAWPVERKLGGWGRGDPRWIRDWR